MAEIIVRTDAAKLQQFENKLSVIQERLLRDTDRLGDAYYGAVWNDMVSEKARVQLNEYIRRLNESMSYLNGVIYAVRQLQEYAEHYESRK